MRKLFFSIYFLFAASLGWSQNAVVSWDSLSLSMNHHRVLPVMGEVHYSRIPASEWRNELLKMKEGGVTFVATYVFWNHVEEQKGIFDWSGQRNLRHFIEICKELQLPVIVRLGPFCHGEVRNGGIPDWVFQEGCRLRSEEPKFLSLVENLYRQIFTQIQGLQWKDGGPVIAAQFDNEYRGNGSYLMALKRIAQMIGFDLPFYTRTGWPALRTPVPYGEMLPLYGDYADGFWDKDIKEGAGDYWKAFSFRSTRTSTAIGTDLLGKQKEQRNEQAYPYFTCELGGGMVTSYHKRVYMYPMDAYAMAVVKLGSGSNLLGYYMYHGGTNPEGKLTALNETQRTPGTANNDLPVVTYDFQAPLNEFGQRNQVYFKLRPLHIFAKSFGELLAPMTETIIDGSAALKKGDDSKLRWSYRSKNKQAFVFWNNYERFAHLSAKKNIQFEVEGVKFPSSPITIPAGTAGIFPVRVEGLKYATAQLLDKKDGKLYLMAIPGVDTEIALDNGKVLKHVKAKGLKKPVYKNIYLLDESTAECYLLDGNTQDKRFSMLVNDNVTVRKIKEAKELRTIIKGKAKVAEGPSEEDWNRAAVYTITIPKVLSNPSQCTTADTELKSKKMVHERMLLEIDYRGDCARLYAHGKLIEDNFYNGQPMQYDIARLPEHIEDLELRILPKQNGAPIYFPKEADSREGESVNSVVLKKIW